MGEAVEGALGEDRVHCGNPFQGANALRPPDGLSSTDAAVKIQESTLYKLLSAGRLAGHKVGRSYRFDGDEVDEIAKHGALARRSKERHRSSSSTWPRCTRTG